MSPEPSPFDEAVEMMARAIDQLAVDYANNRVDMPPDGRGCATVALRALLSPTVIDCETCGGTGGKYETHHYGERGRDWDAQVWQHCPAGCDHGKVTRPSLAAQALLANGELVQVGITRPVRGSTTGAWAMTVPEVVDDPDSWKPLYRFASPEEAR